MMSNHKKPGVAFWASVVVVAMVLYVLSLGPADWLLAHGSLPEWADGGLRAFYSPVALLYECSPDDCRSVIDRYERFWMD